MSRGLSRRFAVPPGRRRACRRRGRRRTARARLERSDRRRRAAAAGPRRAVTRAQRKLLLGFDDTHTVFADGSVEYLLWPGHPARLQATGLRHEVTVPAVVAHEILSRLDHPDRCQVHRAALQLHRPLQIPAGHRLRRRG